MRRNLGDLGVPKDKIEVVYDEAAIGLLQWKSDLFHFLSEFPTEVIFDATREDLEEDEAFKVGVTDFAAEAPKVATVNAVRVRELLEGVTGLG